tara:strand:+ start:2924 stop:3694 length:771 start_codon:yes stop_codon:yes gene_type:complete
MPDLITLQRRFHRAVTGGAETNIVRHIRAGALQPTDRLQIYRNNTYEGFRSALAAAYPVIERLVGQGCFRGLALGYVHEHSSTRGDLTHYGRHLPSLLRARYRHSGFDYLYDIARLEWAYQEVMMAADATSLRPEDIAHIEPARLPDLCLHLHPAVRLVGSTYPILGIWQSNRAGQASVDAIDLGRGGESVLLRRTQCDVELSLLSNSEYALLDACTAGRSLAGALDAALAREPDFDLNDALRRAFTSGIFSGYSL